MISMVPAMLGATLVSVSPSFGAFKLEIVPKALHRVVFRQKTTTYESLKRLLRALERNPSTLNSAVNQPTLTGRQGPKGLRVHLSPLRGSWDLVTRVIIKVTVLIITYNPT